MDLYVYSRFWIWIIVMTQSETDPIGSEFRNPLLENIKLITLLTDKKKPTVKG
jgi:hypothetical protein